MRAQKELKRIAEKASIILEKTYCHEKNVDRNMNIKDISGEILDENKKYVIGNQRRGDLCYKVAQNWIELCSSAGWKVGLASDKLG